MNEELFNVPDVIMRPDIEDQISRYIAVGGGDLVLLISSLSNGYRGTLHKIDILGQALEPLGISFKASFEEFLKKKIIFNFSPKNFDQILTSGILPDWLKECLKSPYWCSVLSDLSVQYPRSRFLSYCMNTICQTHPEIITSIPPSALNYPSFISLLRSRFQILGKGTYSISDLEPIFKIIDTNDLTIGTFALSLTLDNDTTIIHAFSKYLSDKNPPGLKTFQSVILSRFNIHGEAISFIVNEKPISFESIPFLLQVGSISNYTQELVTQLFACQLFSIGTPIELVEKMIPFLTQDVIIQPSIFIEAVKIVRDWTIHRKGNLPYVLTSIKVRAFTLKLLPILRGKMISYNYTVDFTPSPESQIIQSIAWYHPDMKGKLVNILVDTLKIKRPLSGQRIFFSDVYDSALVLLAMNAGPNVFRVFTECSNDIEMSVRRIFLIKAMDFMCAPFSQSFLHEFLQVLKHPMVSILFFPQNPKEKPTIQQMNGLTVLVRFLERLNRGSDSRTTPSDGFEFDEMRRKARLCIDRANK